MEYESVVNRSARLTDEMLKEHIIEVGKKIIDFAEMGIPASGTTGISIFAEIRPMSHITSVKFKIDEYADPRIKHSHSDDQDSQRKENDDVNQ